MPANFNHENFTPTEMDDIERLRRRAPNNRVYQHFLDLGQAKQAKTFIACELVVSYGTAGALLGLVAAMMFLVGTALGILPEGMTRGMFVFGLANMAAADAAGYAIWRMMRADPALARDTRPDYGPMLWILYKEIVRFAFWNRHAQMAGRHGRCRARLRFNKQGEIGVELSFTLAPGETGVTGRGALGRWEKSGEDAYALRFGDKELRLALNPVGAWRIAASPGRDALAALWSAPLDELAFAFE